MLYNGIIDLKSQDAVLQKCAFVIIKYLFQHGELALSE